MFGLTGLELRLIGWVSLAASLLIGYGWLEHSLKAEGATQCRAESQAAALKSSEQARATETQRISDQKEIDNESQRLAARSRAVAAALATAAPGLRAALGARIASSNPPAGAGFKASPAPDVVLTDVLGEVDQRLRDLAAEADARGEAGSACERSYDSLGR